MYDIMTSCRRAVKYERSFVIRVLQLFWCSEVSTNLLMMVINSFFYRDSSLGFKLLVVLIRRSK